jgi:hypothetical protein
MIGRHSWPLSKKTTNLFACIATSGSKSSRKLLRACKFVEYCFVFKNKLIFFISSSFVVRTVCTTCRPRFGSVTELTGDTLVSCIDSEPGNVIIVVHVYESVSYLHDKLSKIIS